MSGNPANTFLQLTHWSNKKTFFLLSETARNILKLNNKRENGCNISQHQKVMKNIMENIIKILFMYIYIGFGWNAICSILCFSILKNICNMQETHTHTHTLHIYTKHFWKLCSSKDIFLLIGKIFVIFHQRDSNNLAF